MHTARAIVLSQGEELLTGQTLDTNTHFLAGALTTLGFQVVFAGCAGDDERHIADLVEWAGSRADVVLCTGGLGPTDDDHTAAAVARACGSALRLDQGALDQIAEKYAARGREVTPANRKQAFLPEGATVVPNPLGTAPGFRHPIPGGAEIWCLPGVPGEMKRMWNDTVAPTLAVHPAVQPPRRHVFRTIGKPESLLQEEIGPIVAGFEGVDLGFRARMPEVEVKLVAPASSAVFEGCVLAVRTSLGTHAFSEDPTRGLVTVLGEALVRRGERLTLAESCTGGLVAHLCVSEAGASRWFDRSWVTYGNAAKEQLLGVSAATLLTHGAVSEEVVQEMASGARLAARADWALALSGVAGPSGGTESKPVGTVCVAVAGPTGLHSRMLYFGDRGRDAVRSFSAWTALDLLRRQIARADRAAMDIPAKA